ncbi:MAG: CoA transferase [Alphaproteobacteria bacterium]
MTGPLAGITVVDLSRILAGPFCTMVLADLGARIIKVESAKGDDSRAFGPFVGATSAYFASVNRGKESIVLDLKNDADRIVFERLIGIADVLVENFRPGVMDRLGYGFEALAPKHPRLVYAAVSGFGHDGPYAQRPAYDLVVQAMGGLMSLTGHAGQPPVRVGTSIGDIAAGLYAAVGIAAALRERELTGRGRKLDIAMLDCQVAILENAISRHLAGGLLPGPMGARHPAIAPFEAFATADGYMVIAAGNDALFRALAATLDRAELVDDPRFRTNDERMRNVDELKIIIESITATRPTRHWLATLAAGGVPCGPINTVADVVADAQVRARNMIVEIADANAGALRVAGNPIKMSGVPDPQRRPGAPGLGEHRATILAELGLG